DGVLLTDTSNPSVTATAMFLVLMGPWILGRWLGKQERRRSAPRFGLINIIGWANLVTSVFPPLGLATGSFALATRSLLPGKRGAVLGWIGWGLAVGYLIYVVVAFGAIWSRWLAT